MGLAAASTLAARASSLGVVAAVVNAAFFEIMGEGSCIVDVASMAGYLIPRIALPRRSYPLSRGDKDLFLERLMSRVAVLPKRLRPEVAYGISKNFVIWYAKTDAARCGAKGIRVLSVSPGSFETPMGEIERDSASAYTKYCAIKRFGCVASGFNPVIDR